MSAVRTLEEEDVGDLFNYDIDKNDPFSNDYQPSAANPRNKESKGPDAAAIAGRGLGLGLDEEVEIIRKPRAPRLKLDENLLLSAAGIPKLRSKAKTIKFRGKGHEVFRPNSPAKFLDAAAMVEKQGHKKRIQAMRMEWIREDEVHAPSLRQGSVDNAPQRDVEVQVGSMGNDASILERRIGEKLKTPEPGLQVEDIYHASPRPIDLMTAKPPLESSSISGSGGSKTSGRGENMLEDGPPEDELEALLATVGKAPMSPDANVRPTLMPVNNRFEDDEEAMAEMEMEW